MANDAEHYHENTAGADYNGSRLVLIEQINKETTPIWRGLEQLNGEAAGPKGQALMEQLNVLQQRLHMAVYT